MGTYSQNYTSQEIPSIKESGKYPSKKSIVASKLSIKESVRQPSIASSKGASMTGSNVIAGFNEASKAVSRPASIVGSKYSQDSRGPTYAINVNQMSVDTS